MQTLPQGFPWDEKGRIKVWTLYYVKVKVRSNKVTKWKCCMSAVRHMSFRSFGTQNLMVAFIFMFCLRKGQYQVKSGQIFKLKIFLQKHAYLFQFCLRISKMSFISRTAIKNAKKNKKVTLSPLSVFFYHCTAKS